MPVISVPTVQADTPVSAPGNPHGRDAPTFRGQPYMGVVNVLTTTPVTKMGGIRLNGEINGQVYLDKIEFQTQSTGLMLMGRRIGGQNSGPNLVVQPYNGQNSSGPAWLFGGVESGDVSSQTYALYTAVANERYVIKFDYPMLMAEEGRFGLWTGVATMGFFAMFHIRIVT